MDKKNIVSIKELVKTYGVGKGSTKAVKGISFEVKKGEFIALSGASGSGKSTTFHQLALLDHPTSGTINFCGKNITNLSEDERSEFRLKKVGYVFQHYELLPEMTAIENILLPIMVDCKITKEIIGKAEKILLEMNLLERKDHYPSELSGGEKQRVAIARALIKEPEIILADEPTANLDSLAGIKIMELLKELNIKKKITVFVINHEKSFEKYFDRIIFLKDGKIDKIIKNKRS